MELPVLRAEDLPGSRAHPIIALIGNPNAGKSTLFNTLTGLRATTANYPGTTVEHRRGPLQLQSMSTTLLDLPGLYDLSSEAPEEAIAKRVLLGDMPQMPHPDLIVLVLDATHLQRNLFLASQILELKRPTVIALNMTDIAEQNDIRINIERLSKMLHCPVVPIAARSGRNLDELRRSIYITLRGAMPAETAPALSAAPTGDCATACGGCTYASRHDWAEEVSSQAIDSLGSATSLRRSLAIDQIATHPIAGLVCFGLVMLATFLVIFWLARFPMDLIERLFSWAAEFVGTYLPEGDLRSLVTNGLIGGVGGLLVFLPQICTLFFFLSLLEDSGYLARAALIMDRIMRRVGLPGKAFVPLLSAHACAIPAIMSCRVVENRRDRLIAILVIPLASCSARVPVYAMLTALLFPAQPLAASLAFAGAYFLGIGAALAAAWCMRKTILPGTTQPLLIELPNYRWPSIRNAISLTVDRAWAFVRNAGTVILVISLVLWGMATYPKASRDSLSTVHLASLEGLEQSGNEAAVNRWWSQTQLEYSFAGRIGKAIQPVFAPLGFDWKMSVGVVTSFAAREVVVSTLAILYGMGENAAEDGAGFYQRLAETARPDGTAVFNPAACWSLLVFYVLAMQCLPTQAITRRETGSWKWAIFQLAYMTGLAYGASLCTYQIASRLIN